MTELWVPGGLSPEAIQQRRLRVVTDLEPSLSPPTTIEERFAYIDGMRAPFTIEFPDEILDPTPFVFMHGYFGIEDSVAELRKYIAILGKRPVVTYPIQRGGIEDLFSLDDYLHPENLHAKTAQAVLTAVSRDCDVEQVDVAPYSMSGLTFASLNDEALSLIRQAHLLAPVGITEMSPTKLARDVPGLLVKDVLPIAARPPFKVDSGTVRDVMRHLLHPVRLFTDGMAISHCDTRERLLEISKIYKMPIITTWFMKDVIIHPEEGHARAKGFVTKSLFLPDDSAGHNAPITHPFAVAKHVVETSQDFALAA